MHANKTLFVSCTTLLALTLTLAGCKSSSPAPSTDDASLAAAVQSRIAGDGAISAEPIQSSVQGRVATLAGNVSSGAARSLAAAAAAKVPGIKPVVNNLTVQTPQVVAAPTPPQAASAPVTAPAE